MDARATLLGWRLELSMKLRELGLIECASRHRTHRHHSDEGTCNRRIPFYP